jgi:hypothetical protein
MITLEGRARRTFNFPAPLNETVAFYTDFERQLWLLPHIRPVRRYRPDSYRVLYHTLEVGAYDVRLYCDVQARYDARRRCLTVSPLAGWQPVAAQVTLRSLVAHGQYASWSEFTTAGPETRVAFEMTLEARLPTPLGLSLVPRALLERLAWEIAQRRIEAIASGYVERSAAAYRTGAAQRPARSTARELRQR